MPKKESVQVLTPKCLAMPKMTNMKICFSIAPSLRFMWMKAPCIFALCKALHDPKLLDDGGEIPTSQKPRWTVRLPTMISSILDRFLAGGQLSLVLRCWLVDLLSQMKGN